MRFGVLGPLQVECEGVVPLGGRKEQAVLAQLLAHANTAVSADRLARGLWGDRPPVTATRTLQSYVARLRRVLEPNRRRGGRPALLVTAADGWMLRVEPQDLDACRFEALVREGRAASAAGQHASAAETFSRALGLWRGAAYAGWDELDDCRTEAVRLTQLRRLAEDERLAALLRLGEAGEVAADAEALLSAEPLRESRWALLIRALYASGRQADALAAYARARELLREEMGVDPGPELQRLQHAVLVHDPALLADAAAVRHELPPVFAAAGPLFVGRDVELDRVTARWASAAAGHGGVLLLAGAEGIGKTRLAAELGRHAAAQRALVLYSAAAHAEQLSALLSAAFAAAGLPVPPDAAEHSDPTSLGRRLTALGRPALIVVDDVHAAGLAAAPTLASLAAAVADLPVLLLAAYRNDVAAPTVAAVEATGLPRLGLGPLAGEHTAAVAHMYAGEDADIDVAAVVAASRGVPLQAHRLAAQAATRMTSRRVGEAARRLAHDRRGLHAVQADLTDGVLAGQRIRQQAALYLTPAESWKAPRSPYKGLAPFEETDGAVFFGRERAVAELVSRLAAGGLVALVGPSGSGKSSLVRAGLLPALRANALPGSGRWGVQIGTPSGGLSTPLDGQSLLVVDQLEEVFTDLSRAQASAFVAAVVDAARPGRVVATLRSDFYGEAAGYPDLAVLLETGTVLLAPMRPDELRRAVADPATVVGLEVSDDLVETVVDDVAGEPGALPLLSVALLETYTRRSGSRLSLPAYEAAGGVRGALARLADEAYLGLPDAQRGALRRMLLRLADEDHGRLVSRRAPRAEIIPPGDADAAAAVEAFVRRRLLVVSDDVVDVAHEALLAGWPRYHDWLADDAAGRKVRAHLTAATVAWQTAGRADTDLYRGPRLAVVSDWTAEHRGDLTPAEQEFVGASQAAAEQDRLAAQARAAQDARQARRLRLSLTGVAVLLVLSLVAGVLAARSADRARRSATAAVAARLGALGLTEPRADTALLLAVQAVSLHPSAETRADLLSTLLRWPEVRRVTVPTGSRLFGLGISPDGRAVAVGDNRGRVAFVNVGTWRRRGTLLDTGTGSPVEFAGFSPDGRFLLGTGSTNDADVGRVTVWDTSTGALVHRVGTPAAGAFLWAPAGAPVSAVSANMNGLDTWTGTPRTLTSHERRRSGALPAGFSPGGTRVLLVEPAGWAAWYDVVHWRALTRRIPVSPGATMAALSADRRMLAVGDANGTTRTYDPRTGRVLATLTGQRGWILDIRFDDGGRRLVTTADDGTAVVRDAATGARIWSFSGLGGGLGLSAAFAPGGRGDRLYLASHDGTLLDVDLTQGPLGRTTRTPSNTVAAAWPNGRDPVLGRRSGAVTALDLGEDRAASTTRPVTADISAFAPAGGGRLVAGTAAGDIVLLDEHDRVARRLRSGAPAAAVTGLAAAGRLVIAATADGRVTAYDRTSGAVAWTRPAAPNLDLNVPGGIAYDTASGRLAVAGNDGTALLLDPATGSLRRRLPVMDDAVAPAVAFDSRSGALLTGARDGSLRIWDPATGRPLSDPIPVLNTIVKGLTISATGNHAVALGYDGSVAVFDITARRLLGRLPIRTGGVGASTVALAPDGTRLLVAEQDGTATLWDLDERSWPRIACAIAGRRLTPAEWHRILPDHPYAPAC